MVIIGILVIVNNVLSEVLIALDFQGYDLGGNFIGNSLEGDLQWIVAGALMIVCGLIALYGYKELSGRGKGDLLVWGIIYIVLGLIGYGLGGLLVLIGGIVLLLDAFL
ncbi:MAG: hypothetical protein ACW97P_05370 [Candidatus Hodarchaeales archaeon]